MSENLLKMLGRHAPADSETGRYYGAYTGIVTNIRHLRGKAQTEEDKGYRVKVRFPWLSETDESHWARISTLMAGPDRGAFWMPEVDDEVVVVFEGGDFRFPIVMGSLYNGVDVYPQELVVTPEDESLSVPVVDQGMNEGNSYRFIKSRERHLLLFRDEPGRLQIVLRTAKSNEIVLDDTDGGEKIQIYDKDNDNFFEIDTVNQKITVESKTGEVHIKAKTRITLECEELVTTSSSHTTMSAGGNMLKKAGGAMEQTAGGAMDIRAGGVLNQRAVKINLN